VIHLKVLKSLVVKKRLVLAFFVYVPFLLSLCSSSVFALIEDGLIFHIPMDNKTGSVAYDESGYGNDGSIYGAKWTSGISENALEFDGEDDYVEFSSPDLTTGELSVSAWVYYNKEPGLGFTDVIISQDDKTRVFQLSTFDGYFAWHRWVIDPDLLSTDPIDIHQWYHVVVTFNGTMHTLYVNGVMNNQQTGSITFDNSVSINVGRVNWGEFYFHGIIDDVRIYNRALLADEIREHYETFPTVVHFQDDFNDGNYDGWVVDTTDWSVINGELTHNTANDVPGRIYVEDSSFTNGVIEVQAFHGHDDADWGISFRGSDFTNCYTFTFENGDFVFRNAGVESGELARKSFTAFNGNWYQLKVEAIGSNIKCYANNELIFDIEDTIHSEGFFGVQCWRTARFDNFIVYSDQLVTGETETSSESQNNPTLSIGTPGYEVIAVLTTIGLISLMIKRDK